MLRKITLPLRPFATGLLLICSGLTAAQTTYDLYDHDILGAPVQESVPEDSDHQDTDWHQYNVKNNDNIWTLFKHERLSEFDLIDLFSASGAGKHLSQLELSPIVHYRVDEQRRLLQLKLMMVTGENIIFDRYQDKFLMTVSESKQIDDDKPRKNTLYQRVSGEISNNFYKSAKAVGLSTETILQFSSIFQSDIDFNRAIQTGDRFKILLEPGDSSDSQDQNTIVAAQFIQSHRTLTALLSDDGNYYTPTGQLIGGTFSRDPLGNSAPISSGFSLSRIHPITGVKQPHLGTDWATPVGTPVYAVADGRVKKAVRGHPAAGNYIELQNGGRYVTRYLHLDRLSVAAEQQVRKGDLIGYSGNTGLSTGPHLHFELYIDGQAVDIMTAKLPDQKQLKGPSLQRFRENSQGRLAQLQQNSDKRLLASLSNAQD
ncbi:peptidoglycan DD-metalloendopeptidase family protein [Endozoicomonas lisbonensis]|uniref:Murein DD-endopeptidase n=1 Tax=Endozoicomonas lisbonensis TaxID=3120522 RepID=A0ABV2SDK8_9GAMM